MNTKVVKILSETELVLGVGSRDNAREGMEFEIYENGEEIKDPSTGESLGTLEIVKGRVYIINVQEKISTAKTMSRMITRTKHVPVAGLSALVAMASGFNTEKIEVEEVDKLRIEKVDSDYKNKLIVRVGNLARQVSASR